MGKKEDGMAPVNSEYKKDRDEYTGNYMATVMDLWAKKLLLNNKNSH